MAKEGINSRGKLVTREGQYSIFRLKALEENGIGNLDRLPFSIRVLLEGVLRHNGTEGVSWQDVVNLATWPSKADERPAMPFFPGRVLMQDFTGVPVVVDLAAMRSAMLRLGGDPSQINPVLPVDLVIDHSVQVDYYGTPEALQRNAVVEFERNRERYELLHWAQKAFNHFRVAPPATGIVHQVNLEYLSKVVLTSEMDGERLAYPDSLVGTDSHTTMVNGLGVTGWGVGGIEAIAAMLGQPLDMLIPDVIGIRVTGQLPEGATPTDLTLAITQMLRQKGVVNKFVEFFGQGLDTIPLTDRAMIANMSPENGATMTFFPVDRQTIEYLRLTGRSEGLIELVETYGKEQKLFRTADTPDPEYTDALILDLCAVEPSLAGPKRPQDRVALKDMQRAFQSALTHPKNEGGYALKPEDIQRHIPVHLRGQSVEMSHGAVAIAAITSCTNTSNPFVMMGAGLLARKALEKGLKVKPYVKTSLAPGSRVVTDYLEQAGLLDPLAKLGFNLVGYGCTTCIGNSGPLDPEVAEAIQTGGLVGVSVLSGNRNFEGRIHPYTLANYLASPPLVVAYALAGTVDIDLTREPLGVGQEGHPVYLRDIWPSSQEILEAVERAIRPEMFRNNYAHVLTGNETWNAIPSSDSPLYPWDDASTYIQEPPYFLDMGEPGAHLADIRGARVLALLGDSITTDHISPAGSIPANGAAGKYLLSKGVQVRDFNSFGSRRGNDRVMTRGTFGNIRLKNQLVPGVEGSFTRHLPEGEQMTIFEAAMKYRSEEVPLIILAGKEYGTGSSRDWAAKGTLLLGVRAVIAESYERIHRSNLVGMGVLPLQYQAGENAHSLGLTGEETFNLEGISDCCAPGSEMIVRAVKPGGNEVAFRVKVRLDTPIDVTYFRNGGIMQKVLYDLLGQHTR